MRKIFIIFACMVVVACSQTTPNTGQTGQVVGMGDNVSVKYVGKFQNGTVFDTNIRSIAKKHSIKKDRYGPVNIKVGAGEVVPGFENALIGMEVGEQKTVTLKPSEAYGKEDPSKIISLNVRKTINRSRELPKRTTVSQKQLRRLPGDTSVGSSVNISGKSYTIVKKRNGTAVIEVNLDVGDVIKMPKTGWNATVTKVSNQSYTVRQDPKNGSVVKTSLGPVKVFVNGTTLIRKLNVKEGGILRTPRGAARVTSMNESEAVLNFNHPFAGKTVTFQINVVGIQ